MSTALYLNNLAVKQDFIAIFASGNSLLRLTDAEFHFIKEKAFVITTNYGPLHFTGHMNCWSDKSVSRFLESYYQDHEKNCLFLCRNTAFNADSELKQQVDYWFNSKAEKLEGNFTAGWLLQLAAKYFRDKTILLFGWDFYIEEGTETYKWYDQFTDYDRNKRGRSGRKINRKLKAFKDQVEQFTLNHPRIINCNPDSLLERFPKKDWRTILQPRVLHIASTPLAGAPAHLNHVLNKYSHLTSRAILKKPFCKGSSLGNLQWDYDLTKPAHSTLKDEMAWADIIHYHNRAEKGAANEKPALVQFHAKPSGYQPGQTYSEFNGCKLVIGQYHPRFYEDAHIVPNVIDIWDPLYKPGSKPRDRVRIFFSWASEGSGWANKGSRETQRVLNALKKQYGDRVDLVVMHNEPYEACMQAKQQAHICIDECVTGSYHLQSLEGCAVGALTFNNMDRQTFTYLQQVSGADHHPFETCGLDALYDKLCYYIDNPEYLAQRQKESRQWMETYWDPEEMVWHFERIYHNVIAFGTLYPDERQKAANKEVTKYNVKNNAGSTRRHQPERPTQRVTRSRKRPADRHQKNNIPGQRKSRQRIGQRERKKEQEYHDYYTGPFQLKQGRGVQAFYQAHQGEPVYIFGTGPSLLQCDPELYKNQICLGINFAFEKMPYMDYHFFHVWEVYKALKDVLPKERMVLPETLVKQNRTAEEPLRVETRDEAAFVYPIQSPYQNRNFVNKHLSLERNTRFFTWSSAMHSAIHIAAYMGASAIYLVGVDYQNFPDGKVHFDSAYYPDYARQDWAVHHKHKKGDEWLRKQLAEKGIKLENLSEQLMPDQKTSKIGK